MTDIAILVKEAIERINNMTPEEIKAVFIKHGYVPSELDKDQSCGNINGNVTD